MCSIDLYKGNLAISNTHLCTCILLFSVLRSAMNIEQSITITSPMSITFQQSQNSQSITFTITDDDVVLEDVEIHDLSLEIEPPDSRVTIGSPGQTTVRIIDDDDGELIE